MSIEIENDDTDAIIIVENDDTAVVPVEVTEDDSTAVLEVYEFGYTPEGTLGEEVEELGDFDAALYYQTLMIQ